MAEAGRRSSVFASQAVGELGGAVTALNGRKEELATGSELLGSVECVVLEPIGKKLAPGDFVTTGVVICLQGMLSSQESLDEWANAAKIAGWLDMGNTVVIPNLQMSPSLQNEDIATVVWAAMELAHFDRCILVGKDEGAQWAVGVSIEPSVRTKVAGVVLVGPSSPPCEACGELEAPAMIIWAGDDDVAPIGGIGEWIDALDERCAPTSVKECAEGGHLVDEILKKSSDGVAEALRTFTATALLIADMDTATQEEQDDGDSSPLPSRTRVDERINRLSGELPDGVGGQKRRNSRELASWIQAGMTTASE
jgi:hypothetical protein